MAFTGSATVTEVSDSLVRITGLSLAGAANGTISLSGGTGAVKTPANFKPAPYRTAGGTAGGNVVALQDSVQVWTVPNNSAPVVTLVPITVTKTGTTITDFLITLTNTTAATASDGLEIYVKFH